MVPAAPDHTLVPRSHRDGLGEPDIFGLAGGQPGSMGAIRGLNVTETSTFNEPTLPTQFPLAEQQYLLMQDAASGANSVTVNFYWALECF